MRNLKRALSLALASVMLLGMMVVGTSAASINDFTDVDEINNKEAVAIATGLGIFDGYTDGSFGPEKAVTRAEAAVVIAKILHGSDVNPSNLAGAGKFTDVPAWAEGYVNLVAALKIIEGRGAGIFDPNATVTTVEYTTMLLKALGYYVDAETALNADWKLEVTSKANALGLYGDLELGMNAPLSREDVAALTFNALFAQRVAYNDYRGQYVKATDRDVVVTNGTKDDLNTLADNTFGLYAVEGIVTANGMTDEALSESLKSEAQTTVVFTDDTDLNKDGKAEYVEGEAYDFEVETGLDMIGHAATVYYTIEKKAPVVFAIVDEATLVEYVTYNANTTKLAKAANDLGFKKNSILDVKVADYIINYDMNATVASEEFNADNLDTLIVISNSANYEVDYVIALDQYLDTVAEITEDDDEIEYYLTSGNGELNIAMDEVSEEDYVIVTNIGNQGEVVVFEAAELVSSNISKITGISDDSATVKKVLADGETYTKSAVAENDALDLVKYFDEIATIGAATLIVDEFGKLIGLANEKDIPNYAYIAQYGVVHSTGSLNTTDSLTAHVYFADGTDGIYEVNSFDDLTNGFNKTTKLTTEEIALVKGADAKINTANGQDAKTGALGIWNVVVKSNGKIDISAAKTTEETANGTIGAAVDKVDLIKGHSTFVYDDKASVQGKNEDGCVGQVLYQNNDTVYFYVTGEYDDDLEVEVITGIKNAISFENEGDKGIQQVFATLGKLGTDGNRARSTVGAVLVEGIEFSSETVYYYNEGNYHVEKGEDGYTLTFDLFALDGEAVSVSYDGYSSVSTAQDDAVNLYDGFYQAKANGLVAYKDAVSNPDNDYVKKNNEKTYYVVNDNAKYDEYIDNLYTQNDKVGTIAETPVIVDACNSGLDTLAKLVKAIKTTGDGNVKVAFTYSTSDYVADVIFVSYYNPKATQAPGAEDVNEAIKSAEYTTDGVITVEMETEGVAAPKSVRVVVRSFSAYVNTWTVVFDDEVKLVDGQYTVPTFPQTVDGVTLEVKVDGILATEAAEA